MHKTQERTMDEIRNFVESVEHNDKLVFEQLIRIIEKQLKKALQKNLWVDSGKGSSPSL
jgi:ribosomal protein S20